MPKDDSLQLELFAHTADSRQAKTRPLTDSFLTRIRHYEKIILIIFAMAITGIISFSAGVEKGKKIVILPDIARPVIRPAIPETAAPVLSPALSLPKQPVPVEGKKAIIEEPRPKETITGNYTIQLASYRKKTHAQKAAKVLKKRGLTPIVLPKGNYIVLYVGPFPDRIRAQNVLSELKKQYQDCRIRRL